MSLRHAVRHYTIASFLQELLSGLLFCCCAFAVVRLKMAAITPLGLTLPLSLLACIANIRIVCGLLFT